MRVARPYGEDVAKLLPCFSMARCWVPAPLTEEQLASFQRRLRNLTYAELCTCYDKNWEACERQGTAAAFAPDVQRFISAWRELRRRQAEGR